MRRTKLSIVAIIAALVLFQSAASAQVRIGGRVTDPYGLPFPEAVVKLLPYQDPVSEVRSVIDGEEVKPAVTAVTDPGGYFVLEAPHAGLWQVKVVADGFIPMVYELQPLLGNIELPDAELESDEGLELTVLGRGGKPVAGAWARLSRRGGPAPRFFGPTGWRSAQRSGVTDGEGKVRLPRPYGDRAGLIIAAPGYVIREYDNIRGTAVNSTLESGKSREVAVLTAESKPAPDVLATGERGVPLGFTDADGKLILTVPENGMAIDLVTTDGRRTGGRVVPATGESPTPRTFSLPEQVALEGRVIDILNRESIAGAVVWSRERPWEAAITGRSGRFTLQGPDGSSRVIVAGAVGYLRAGRTSLKFVAGEERGPTIALAPGASIEGSVVDGTGSPVIGANLKLAIKRPASGMMVIEIGGGSGDMPETRTDSRGRFRLSPVDPDNNYTLTASAEGLASSSRDVLGLEPRRTVKNVRLELSPGMTVTGSLVDPDGAPVPDSEITLTPAARGPASMGHMSVMMGGEAPEGLGGWTDEDGIFVIGGVKEGAVDLEATRLGFARFNARGLEVPESAETIDLGEFTMEPGAPVQGVVNDTDGQPIEGVEVRADRAGGGMMFMVGPGPGPVDDDPDAVTGPDGWFVIHDLAKDASYNLSFSREGFVNADEAAVPVPQEEPVSVTMQAASSVSGTVFGPEEEPIPGATVNMTRSVNAGGGGMVMQMIMQTGTTTDDDGYFIFEDLEPGTISLSAVAGGWQETKIEALEIPKGEDLEGIELPLEPGAVLLGQVLAPDGRPAVNARIREITGKSSPAEFVDSSATTDGDGYYRLEGLAPGEISVEATHDNYIRTAKDVEIDAGVMKLDFQFQGGRQVSGTVVDPTGSPVPGASIQLIPAGRRWGGPNTLAGMDGRFTFEGVADGSYTIEGAADGYAPYHSADPILVEGDPVEGLLVELGPASVITGRILGLEPARFSDVRVNAFSRESGFRESGVDRQGAYRIEDVGPGKFEVTASVGMTGRQASDSVTIESGQTEVQLDLSFGEGLTLSGKALMGESPVKGAMVFARGVDINHNGDGRTDNQGAFSLEGLEAGTYRVELRKWDTGLSYDETVEVSSNREVVLRVPTARVIGHVRDSIDKEALAGVRVDLTSDDGGHSEVFPAYAAVTDLNGRFEIANVPDGSWMLNCNKKGYAAGSLDVPIINGRDRDDLRVDLDPTEGLILQVRHGSGTIPGSVQVSVLDPTGRAVTSGNFATGENGSVRLASVPPGEWELLLGAAGAGYSRIRASAPGGPVAVTLPPACSLRIEVPDLAGSGMIATASLVDSGGRPFVSLGWLGTPTGEIRLAGGRTEIGTLPPDSWTVRVTASDGRRWDGSATTTPGATGTLVLE